MFLQIVDALSKLVSIITTGSSITQARNKRRLGRQLVGIQQSVANIALTARSIEKALQDVIEFYQKRTNGTYLPGGTYYPGFHHIFDYQRHELLKLDALIQDCDSLIEVYGPDCAKELEPLIALKISFIDFLSHIFLELPSKLAAFDAFDTKPGEYRIILPRTFDLMAFKVFRNHPYGEYQSEYHAYGHEKLILDTFCVDIRIQQDGKEEELVAHCSKLLKEMIDMNTSSRLQNIADELAKMIRDNFRLEEIF